jgi:non-ribosomal peptide synthetase-like protein
MNKLVSGLDLEAAVRATTAEAAVLRGETRPDLVRDEVLAELFATTATARGYRIAYVSEGRVWTYAQVHALSDSIARGLVRAGIGPGDVVGLWMPRGVGLLVAQIAITKSGAAWLPFDADAPVERIGVCLADAAAKALLTDEAHRAPAAAARRPVLVSADLDDLSDEAPLDPRGRGLTADHPAYLIYTSGSTGTPKGIVVTHRNICHFLRSANEVYGVKSDDVMFQAASLAFDLSMEEVWVPYLVGATLFVATPAILGDVERLPDVMDVAGITVLDMVPTLLAMLPREVPSVRLILVGGEALAPSLVERWEKPGRRFFNTYGPTEATVVATAAEVRAGEAVTIGRPIPNYSCYVADESLNPLPAGVPGELLIGGPGVAKGYLGRPDLTAEKFVANPFPSDGTDPILYRSGDAVSIDADGNIAFHGRIDDQVKIRGFRVELGEIETKIAALPGVSQVAVVMRQDDGIDRLVAFIVSNGQTIDRLALRLSLRDRLPSYMIPSHFEIVDQLPRLTSGKVDRKALRLSELTAAEAAVEETPRNPTEAALMAAAKRVFPGQAIGFEADFFTELGGHSLIAARFVSAVRGTPALATITLQDVYSARTLRAISAKLGADRRDLAEAPRDLSFAAPPTLRRFLCGLAQAAALPFILALMTAQWLGIFISYMLLSGENSGLAVELVILLGVYMTINVVTVFVAIAGKWLILGRTRPGRYPLWGVYYYRWWLTQRLLALTHAKWFQGSPVMRWYLRALGARVGRDALIAEVECGAVDLVSIGAGAAIGGKVRFANAEVIGNELVIGTIDIGADAYVGTSCVIGHDVVVGESAELGDLTTVAPGTRVGAAEQWDGSPGRCVGHVDLQALPAPPTASRARKGALGLIYLTALLVLPPISLLPIFPAFYLFERIDDIAAALAQVSYIYYLPVLAWPTAMSLVAATVLLIAAVRWLVLPRVREGSYSVYSGFYVRKWIVALANEVTLETLSSLYATVYMRAWYRLMGAKIGKDAEISCNLAGRYDLTVIGEKCFIADEVVLGDEELRRGWMTLRKVETGARVFVGNDAVVPPGASIPDGALIGIKSKPPANAAMAAGDTWFGSPPLQLPTRQKVDGISANWTYEPSRWRRAGRMLFEAFNLSLPTMLFITCGTLAVEILAPSILAADFAVLVPLFIALSVAISLVMTLTVASIKWLLMGRYAPVMKPMWSWWAMRTEAVAVMYWGLAGKVLLDHLRGTPMLPWTLAVFGARFGKGVFMDTTDITEFDCIKVGDFVSINSLAALQTHLYEDRVMKVGRIEVGNGVTLGANATVLYDTRVGDYARLGPLTLVMKGEEIPPSSEWAGAPAEPVRQAPVERPAALKVAA